MDKLIKRQDAIVSVASAIWHYPNELYTSLNCFENCQELAERALNHLPYAESEIIRCKDCRWWDKSEDSQFGYCMAMKHGYISANWEIGIYRRYKGDWYCADAERRTDE